MSLEVFIVKGSKPVQSCLMTAIIAERVWYTVELYTNAGPDSMCESYYWWGHIENKCGSKAK